MPMDRSKFKNIVGGITTPVTQEVPQAAPQAEQSQVIPEQPIDAKAGEGGEQAEVAPKPEKSATIPAKRFAKTGRPKGRATGKSTKEKVSLYIDKSLLDELYDWAYQDRVQPGEMIERALRNFRDREAKRRNAGTE